MDFVIKKERESNTVYISTYIDCGRHFDKVPGDPEISAYSLNIGEIMLSVYYAITIRHHITCYTV